MFEGKKKACKFARLQGGYHAGGGPLGMYRIDKLPGRRGYRIQWSGGSVRNRGEATRKTLDAAKKFVAYRLGCKYPARKR